MEEEAKHHHETHPTHSSEESVKIPVKLLISVAVIIVVLVLGFFIVKSGILSGSGGTVSEKEATSKLLTWFAVNAPESEVTFVSVSKQGTFYEIILNIDGQDTPVPVTIDGKYIVPDRIPLE